MNSHTARRVRVAFEHLSVFSIFYTLFGLNYHNTLHDELLQNSKIGEHDQALAPAMILDYSKTVYSPFVSASRKF